MLAWRLGLDGTRGRNGYKARSSRWGFVIQVRRWNAVIASGLPGAPAIRAILAAPFCPRQELRAVAPVPSGAIPASIPRWRTQRSSRLPTKSPGLRRIGILAGLAQAPTDDRPFESSLRAKKGVLGEPPFQVARAASRARSRYRSTVRWRTRSLHRLASEGTSERGACSSAPIGGLSFVPRARCSCRPTPCEDVQQSTAVDGDRRDVERGCVEAADGSLLAALLDPSGSASRAGGPGAQAHNDDGMNGAAYGASCHGSPPS